MEDNPLAKTRGLSLRTGGLRTGGQPMIQLLCLPNIIYKYIFRLHGEEQLCVLASILNGDSSREYLQIILKPT